MPRDISR
jgi:hypothetical protein